MKQKDMEQKMWSKRCGAKDGAKDVEQKTWRVSVGFNKHILMFGEGEKKEKNR